MERRRFLRSAAVAGTISAAATPAASQSQPQPVSPPTRWRMASSFPKSLDTLFGGSEEFVKRVGELTSGRFQISTHAAGELVPGLQVLDAVQQGTIEAGQTTAYYYVGKDATWTFGTTLPFGMNARQHSAWWHYGGGEKLFNEFAEKYGVKVIQAGHTGAQMGGWFRKPINGVEDLKGLKFRVGGFAGQVLQRVGVVPQQLAAGDVYAALEKGALDAVEFVGPADDEKLGFVKVAKYYYYPGWWDGTAAVHVIVSLKAWEALPADYRAAVEAAAMALSTSMLAKYDAANALALKRLVAAGAQLRAFPRPVLDECYKAAQEVFAEHNAKSADFKKLYDSYVGFQRDVSPWFRVTENSFDDYVSSVTSGGTRRTP